MIDNTALTSEAIFEAMSEVRGNLSALATVDSDLESRVAMLETQLAVFQNTTSNTLATIVEVCQRISVPFHTERARACARPPRSRAYHTCPSRLPEVL